MSQSPGSTLLGCFFLIIVVIVVGLAFGFGFSLVN